ncbi:AI-2E family transporter [Hoeflea poritis]|uniref:AI-2E family transporter n=1 Tax=Hoeflea poritis TaxID=2993659 RepID=A0ABT4VM72_9HYPH|nr:AI-2E family transporter [Hoeflea poritis]MDA4845138.1 AI-2E family transporter [Hoeflea poritis]
MNYQHKSVQNSKVFAVGLAALAITALFVGMISDFLITLFLAAVFSAMSQPLYLRILALSYGRKSIAAAATLILLYVCILAPVLGIIVLAASQAQDLAGSAISIGRDIDLTSLLSNLPDWLPFRQELERAAPTVVSKVGELADNLAVFVVSTLSVVTRGTASFFINLFVLTYAMVFFLQESTDVLTQLLRFLGLSKTTRSRVTDRVMSVSRATIKGTLVIGVIQGLLGGLGFLVTGIPGAAFWSMIIAVLSVIPGVGPGLVLIPGVIYLFIAGQAVSAIALLLWTLLVVTTVDNLLRPTLVGRDTKMPDLLILISTLGGLSMFGAAGLLIGPVIAGVFVTVWQILAETAKETGNSEANETTGQSE